MNRWGRQHDAIRWGGMPSNDELSGRCESGGAQREAGDGDYDRNEEDQHGIGSETQNKSDLGNIYPRLAGLRQCLDSWCESGYSKGLLCLDTADPILTSDIS